MYMAAVLLEWAAWIINKLKVSAQLTTVDGA